MAYTNSSLPASPDLGLQDGWTRSPVPQGKPRPTPDLPQIRGQPLACLCPIGWHSGSSLYQFFQLNCGLQTNRSLQGLLWRFPDWVYRTTPSSQNAGSTHKIWRTTLQKWISKNEPSQGLGELKGLQRGGSMSASHGRMVGIWQWEILK